MLILSNAELNKLNHIEYTLDKGLKNIVQRFEENDQHFGADILEFLEDTDKFRNQETNVLKIAIQSIVKSLWSKLDLLKNNKIGEIKDFTKFKQEMVDIQENIFNTKSAAKLELNNLTRLKDDLSDELNIYYYGKVPEWSEPLNINTNYEFTLARVKSRNTGQCKEVKQFFEFVHQSGGHENGWRRDDHLLFLKFRNKYKKIDDVAFYLHEVLPDKSIDEIKSHGEWYKRYLHLQLKKKEAINRWKQNKNSKNAITNINQGNSNFDAKYKEDDTRNLREQLLLWKAEKEDKLVRERELERQRLLDKIENERLEKQRQINIKSIVNEWRESKVTLEQTKKQNRIMFNELERKRRSALANKLIKQFQSMDELHILKMRQIHKKLTDEPPKRVQSGPPALRDPKRLMQPTEQWVHRVRSVRESMTRPLPLFSVPKLAIPDWRKSIT